MGFCGYSLYLWLLLWPWVAPWSSLVLGGDYPMVRSCPIECSCTGQVVSCGHRGLIHVPRNLPSEALRVELEGNILTTIKAADFEQIPNLRYLTLLNNNIRSIASNAFRTSRSLRKLRLNNNQLRHLPDGLFHNSPHLIRLDLSHNQLTVLNSRMLEGARNLQTLQLDNNQLTCIEEISISHLRDLQVITLHNNNLTTLPSDLFSSLRNLRSVRLADNAFVCDCRLAWLGRWLRRHPTLALFTRCQSPFALRGKEVAEVQEDAFICTGSSIQDESCPSSQLCPDKCRCSEGIVDCRDRGLTHVPIHIPEDTSELRLEQNQIMTIPERAFAPFRKLRRIDLSNNQISSIAGDAFEGLKLLNSLVLYGNKITELGPGTFAGLTSLQLLLLNANKITCLRRDVFADLRNLNLLSLYDNNIRTIPNATFNMLSSIQTLHLGRNPFVCDCSLQWLSEYLEVHPIETSGARCEYPKRLQRRKITALTDERLKCTDDTVSQYAGECVSEEECPRGCTCRGTTVDCTAGGLTAMPESLPQYTTNLLLSDNEIRELGMTEILPKLKRLKRLVLTNNQLRIITTNAFLGVGTLQELDLSENDLTQLTTHMLEGLSRLTTLNLAGNRLSCISPGAFASLNQLKEINLEGNPLHCSCHMIWLAKWFRNRGVWKSVPRCHSPPHLRDTPITEVPSSSFSCGADEVGCLGMTENCPKGCECEGTVVRCTRANLRAIPENIPAHTTELYLDFNTITEIDPQRLAHLKSLMRLDLSNNQIAVLENGTFAALSQLSALIVSYSKVQCIQGDALSGLHKLRILSIHGNDISIIPEGTFRDLSYITHLALGANPLFCDCSLAWLSKFIKTVIVEPGIARCAEPDPMRDKLVLTTPTDSFQCKAKVPTQVLAKCDLCFTFPCQNGGTCRSFSNRSYACLCPPAYHGQKCQYKIDACYGNPCENQGTCKVLEAGRFSCHCPPGFEGLRCEKNIDDCHNNKCENNSTCVDLVMSYRCQCQPGYTGDYCEKKIAFCSKEFNPCKNSAKCVDHFTHYECQCLLGFVGDNCTENVNDCTDHLCQNGASCIDNVNYYTCKCVGDYSGKFCEVGPDVLQQTSPCQQNDCQNGICFVPPNSQDYVCKCSPGFSGKHCEYLTRVHFGHNNSFLSLDSLKTKPHSNVTLRFKTSQQSGILLYTGESSHLAIELFLGRIRVSYDVGNHPVSNMFSYEVVSDGKWHVAELLTHKQNFTMRIDGGASRWIINAGRKEYLSTSVPLFLGGLPHQIAMKAVDLYHVRDPSSFHGCIQRVYVNGRLTDLSSGKQHKVVPGCGGEEAIRDEEQNSVLSLRRPEKRRKSDTLSRPRGYIPKDVQIHPPAPAEEEEPPKRDPCENHKCRRGRCKTKKRNPFKYYCRCRTGWSGKFCDQPPTCRKEQFTEYYVENECRSRKPIKNAICSGTCGNHCCKPRKTKQRKVRLICNDGTSYRKEIEIIRKCRCIRRCY